jgi:hypothetical protein
VRGKHRWSKLLDAVDDRDVAKGKIARHGGREA